MLHIEVCITQGLYLPSSPPNQPEMIFCQFNFPEAIYECKSAIYIVKHRNVNKERKFLPNYIISQDLDKSLIYLSYFQ